MADGRGLIPGADAVGGRRPPAPATISPVRGINPKCTLLLIYRAVSRIPAIIPKTVLTGVSNPIDMGLQPMPQLLGSKGGGMAMPYVMVPVPEEHVLEVMGVVMRLAARRSHDEPAQA